MSRPAPRLVAPVLGLLLLAGCGKDGAAPATSPRAPGDAPQVVFAPDPAPWLDAPAGEGWELAGWIPRGSHMKGRLVEPAFLREHGAGLHTQSVWFETVRAWTRWVREVGLPEDGFRDVIVVTQPLTFQAYRPRGAPEPIDAVLRAQGYTEQVVAGARAFVAPEAQTPTLAWIDGRLVMTSGEPGEIERLVALRAGSEPSARAFAAAEAALRAAGPGLPVEIEAAEPGLEDGVPGAPPALASVGRLAGGAELHEVRALALRDEADVATFRTVLERLLSQVPLGDVERPRLGTRGAVVRLTTSEAFERLGRSAEGGIHNDLGSLSRALERYRSERGALPTAAQGLAALAEVPGCLDEFLGALPRDRWGRPYAYQPDHPKRPGGFVLRSLGPDGEIDTEDDVLPEE